MNNDVCENTPNRRVRALRGAKRAPAVSVPAKGENDAPQERNDNALRIVVRFDPSRLSLNQRLHWATRKRRNDAAKAAALFAWAHAGCPVADGPVVVSAIVRRGRTIDNDNAITGLKPALDALFKGAITPDDSTRWVRIGSVTQKTGARWRGAEEVEFIIEEDER